MRKAVFLMLGLLFCCSAVAFAGAPAPLLLQVSPSLDPYVTTSDVQTVVPMVPRCPCTIISGCGFQQIGFDCAQPAHCCSCRGFDPALRMCVGVPS